MAMPTSIVLADAMSTPVNHTYLPIQDGPESKWVNSATAITIAGQETLAVEVTRAKTDAAQHKGRVVLWDPVEATVDGQTKVVYGGSGATNFTFAPQMTLQERKNLVKKQANALLNADIVDALVKAQPFI